MKRRVSIKEVMDENSPYVQEISKKFLDLYGDELDTIIKQSKDHNKPYVDIEKE